MRVSRPRPQQAELQAAASICPTPRHADTTSRSAAPDLTVIIAGTTIHTRRTPQPPTERRARRRSTPTHRPPRTVRVLHGRRASALDAAAVSWAFTRAKYTSTPNSQRLLAEGAWRPDGTAEEADRKPLVSNFRHNAIGRQSAQVIQNAIEKGLPSKSRPRDNTLREALVNGHYHLTTGRWSAATRPDVRATSHLLTQGQLPLQPRPTAPPNSTRCSARRSTRRPHALPRLNAQAQEISAATCRPPALVSEHRAVAKRRAASTSSPSAD